MSFQITAKVITLDQMHNYNMESEIMVLEHSAKWCAGILYCG